MKLVLLPENLRDYVILHELVHTREHNHSAKFWKEVERVIPDYLKAKDWLKKYSGHFEL